MEGTGQYSREDSCSYNHDPRAPGNRVKVRDKKDDRLLLHPIRRQNRLTARVKSPHRESGSKQESPLDKSEILRHVNYGILRVSELQV